MLIWINDSLGGPKQGFKSDMIPEPLQGDNMFPCIADLTSHSYDSLTTWTQIRRLHECMLHTDRPEKMAYTAPKKENPQRICFDISNAIHQVAQQLQHHHEDRQENNMHDRMIFGKYTHVSVYGVLESSGYVQI